MGPKKPTHSYRLQTPSVPELVNGMVVARLALNERDVKHRGRKLKDGPLLNALAAWFLALPADEQERVAREGLGRFEAILGGVSPGADDDDGPAPGEAPAYSVGREVGAEPARGDRRRRKA